MIMVLPQWPRPQRFMFDSEAAYLVARNDYLIHEKRRQKQIRLSQMFFTIMIYALFAMAALTIIGLAYLTYITFWS